MGKNNRAGKAAIVSESDFARIRKAIQNPAHRLLLEIAWYTGERFGAIRQLGVMDVYHDPGRSQPREEITFRAQTRKADPAGQRFTRQCPIHPALREILRGYQPPAMGYLFPSPYNPDHPLGANACDKFLRASLYRCGLYHRGISTHSFRRSFITHLSEQGVDLRVIQSVTGHRDIKTTSGYVDVTPDRERRAISLR